MEIKNITSAQYIDDDNNNHLNIEVVAGGKKYWVPIEEGNRHYDEIKKQVDAGTLTIKDAE
tara:strand:+ start:1105 stop:1287 length:183 start_codon:yes stop_codon:yes gene_type:complete